jgi:hypothetical protein
MTYATKACAASTYITLRVDTRLTLVIHTHTGTEMRHLEGRQVACEHRHAVLVHQEPSNSK